MTNTCGVGGWGGVKPGDPSNDSILTATPAFGGIDVQYYLPTTNPYAVAYAKLYRGTSSDFNSAIFLKEMGDSFYYDKLDSGLTYYYWIQFVSVNGTVGDLIGPASATARPTIEAMIELLTGQIDAGVLATTLKTEIARIQTISVDLAGETAARENGEITLSQAMAAVNDGVAQTLTFLKNEQTSRIDGISALADSINLVAVTAGNNLAAVQTTAHAEVMAVDGRVTALGDHLDAVVLQQGYDLAQAVNQLHAEIQAIPGGSNVTAEDLQQVALTASNQTSAAETRLNTSINTLGDKVNNLSSHVDQVESAAADNLSQVQLQLSTNLTSVGDKVTDIGALLTAKLSVNGLIGGFGVYNDGSSVEAGFDVDTFWVGRTNANKRKPFIIDNDIVYLDDAAINKLTFSKLRDESGSFVVENGRIKATYLGVEKLSALSADLGTVTAGTLKSARISIGTSALATTFFDPTNDSYVLQSSANGTWTYTGTVGQAVATGNAVLFKTNDSSWAVAQRIRTGAVYFFAIATAVVDDQLSIWYRVNGGAWVWANGLQEPGTGDGTVAVGVGLTLTLSLGDTVQFGLSPTTSTYTSNDLGKLYLKGAALTVQARNF